MNIIVYDLTFLVLFAIFVAILLYRGKKNLKKEGILLLYKAQWGMKLIDYVGLKYKKTIHALSYVSIVMGYFLMVVMIYLFGKIMWIYLFAPKVVSAVKIPPIMPLVPYLPQIFKLDFLPPFYFVYWIVILAVIAIPHEFFHGIFARKSGVRIKSTGFGFFPFFLPVFLAAFVEQDEEDMKSKPKFDQLAILSAGTFANVLTAILVFLILVITFSLSFTPVGVTFDSYAYSFVPFNNVTSINGVDVVNPTTQEILDLSVEGGYNYLIFEGESFIINTQMLEDQINRQMLADHKESSQYLSLYYDAPAINSKLTGAISKINNDEILELYDLSVSLEKYSPGETVRIETINEDEDVLVFEVTLEKNPDSEGSWLGIGFVDNSGTGVKAQVFKLLASFKKPHTAYVPAWGGWSMFIYNLLWWLVLILVSVALVNMLPVGIFDGGMFFYLSVWKFTGSEKIAEKAYKFVTYGFLALVALLMVLWAKAMYF
jgi:membrane-associated protease RseP (regulator of RpoE activity)